jgi:hypothetical protein
LSIRNGMFEAELKKLVQDRMAEISEQICAGMMDEREYRRQTGMLAGLRAIYELCDEANTNLDKR